ncbi:hypothetical protein LV82_02811 [Albidovulum inexpectatum]|uniref:Uncharacterized protein n=1 Tax=Albidovulum inexpectatum TaxID=196587 RepID=A0A2S5JDM2_9RHOB|nr:pyridoxamine 5'-phosphate oxidase family protein [Albidovulum inexpectatum]PPB79529.1 hypothetical protein LV82_02811 [Albidovulum inexpectatum]
MTRQPKLVQPANDAARKLARDLLRKSCSAAIAVPAPDAGPPLIARIAFGLTWDGLPMTLVSGLSQHGRALARDPRASLLIGDPGSKGDPLTHPRLSLRTHAEIISPQDAARHEMRAHWLRSHPKSKLYVDFPDFRFAILRPLDAFLNAGFGKAYELSPEDLKLTDD